MFETQWNKKRLQCFWTCYSRWPTFKCLL